jgi:Flp pilus assembly pilin Flp
MKLSPPRSGLRHALRRLRHSERGQGLVEYALIIVVVSLGVIASLTFLRGEIRGLFSKAGSSLAIGAGATGGGGSTNQTITFGALSDRALGSGTFTVSATASSALTVAFTSATTSQCTVSGTTVTLVAAGTCTINANQAGNGSYNPAPQVQQSFTVGAAATAPGPVTSLLLTNPGGTTTTATWSAPTTGGTVTGYEYYWEVNLGFWTTFGQGTAANPLTTATTGASRSGVNGLNYRIVVRATGPGGPSAWTTSNSVQA